MILEPKEIILKNGLRCIVRTPSPEDAVPMVDYLRATWGETEYLLRYPEEATITEEEEKLFLRDCAQSERRLMLAAFVGDEVVGTVGVHPLGDGYKIHHRASLGVALRKKVWSLGMGTILMKEALSATRQMGYEQLELEVSSQNRRARGLYEKLGFVACGEIPHGFRLKSGGYASLVMMVKML